MALVSDCACIDILAVVVALVVGFVTYFKWAHKYWERKGIPYLQPTIPFGTLSSPLRNPKSFGDMTKIQYHEAKTKGYNHVGLFAFTAPMYMPLDPEIIKNIVSVDFKHFVDRGVYYNEKDDPLSAHLFSLEGNKWRNLRMKLTPTFTSGKMKMMFQTLVECGTQLQEAMDDMCLKNEPIDIKEVLARFTTDIIGSCAFGLDCNSFTNPNSEFRKYGKRMLALTKIESLKGLLGFTAPRLARFLGITITPLESAEFFMRVIKETVEFREKNNFVRKDFMQLLVDLKNNANQDGKNEENKHDGKSLSIEEIAAQAFVFFLAGYETSSTTMTFCLFELSLNPEIQEKVRNEINSVLKKHDGKITYEAITEMKYMGQVIDETLRKYPSLPVLNRKCVETYKVPGTNITLEEGMPVLIPLIGLHHDEEYFPEPEKFNPERFNESNKSQINPYTYMPFGEGPRICIGLRFGVMQTKVGLTVLLKHYKFSLNEKTDIPLKMNPLSFITSTLGAMLLDAEKI